MIKGWHTPSGYNGLKAAFFGLDVIGGVSKTDNIANPPLKFRLNKLQH